MTKNADLRSDYHACGDDGHGLCRPPVVRIWIMIKLENY